ncbi:MAG: tetratricopeptide repeat protein, partial [Planctomycetota bacterium]
EAKDGRPTKSGPLVRYGEGPTRRVELPKTTLTRPEGKTPTVGKGPAGKSGKDDGAGKSSGGSHKADRPVKTKSLGDLKHEAPDKLDDVRVLTRGISRAQDIATGVAFGTLGGVRPGGYYGGLPLDGNDCHDSFGWNSPWYGNSWCYWGGPWWGSTCYFSWYYPYWWWCSRPYTSSYYAYWPVTTVIYSDEPDVIYIERESAPADEPVGEAVVAAPAQPGQAPSVPSADSPLSIAAQRYLELGDRAFREGRYADAVQFYAKAVEFAPDQGALYLVLADALFAAGDYHYGAYAVRRALELDPALVESNIDKHGFYPDPAQFDAQLTQLEQFLAEHPSDRDARLVLALNYLFGGRAREAARTIDSAVTAMAEDAAAQKILARAKTVAGS